MGPTDRPYATPIGPLGLRTICNDPDDGHRNWYVTLAYRDLSRVTAAYTHGIRCGCGETTSGATTAARAARDPVDLAARLFDGVHQRGEEYIRRAIGTLDTGASVDVRVGDDGARPSGPTAVIAEMAQLGAPATRSAQPQAELPLNANFCTYAMWSSLTLGRDIQNTRLPIRFDGVRNRRLRQAASRLAVDARRTNDNELARLLGLGQRAVLWEVGTGIYSMLLASSALDDLPAVQELRFADFDDVDGSPTFTDAATEQIADQIDGWLSTKIRPRGLDGLAQLRSRDLALGLASYHLARRAALEGRERADRGLHRRWVAELILRGNLLIGAYEQRRVDQVLTFPVQDFAGEFFLERSGIEAMERSGQGRWRARADRVARRGAFGTRALWSRFFTDQVLVLRAGDELLRLGRDLPIPPGQTSFLPADLQDVRDRWLRMLLYRYDHSYGDGHGTQSRIWAVFDDRMNFIANFMRSRAQTPGLWKEPFDPDDMRWLRRHHQHTPRYHR
jgi:hypothetical protein